MSNSEHIYLLSKAEISDLYAQPEFNSEEQTLYFTLNEAELKIFQKYSNIKTQIYFILQLGYFKAKQQFFKFNLEEVSTDVEYILVNFFKNIKLKLSGKISRDYISQQKKDILNLFNYKTWSPNNVSQVESHISELLRFYPKSHNALRQLLNYFEHQQIVIPSYRVIQDMFTAAFSKEEKRLEPILSSISETIQTQLTALIKRNDTLSQLNLVRSDQKNFQYTAVKEEVAKAKMITELYEYSKTFLPTLELSKNAIRYYADIAEQYTASRLRRLSKPQQQLYALCFIYHRYQQIMNNLISTFMYRVRDIMDGSKVFVKAAADAHASSIIASFPDLAQFLKWFPEREEHLNHEALNKAAYNKLSEEQFPILADFFNGNTFDSEAKRWEFYLQYSRAFALYLRPILIAVPFAYFKENSTLMKFIDLLKSHYAVGKNPATLKIPNELQSLIPEKILPYLKNYANDEQLNPSLFEFYVYQKMNHNLDRGKLYCNDSVTYCDIEQDLVEDALVDKIEEWALKLGYPKIPIYCDKRLDDAVEELNAAWDRTTGNINAGENREFNIKEIAEGQYDWTLLYDSNEPLDEAFFKTVPKIEIADLLMFKGNRVGLWDYFTHIKDRYTKRKKPVVMAVNACILAEAFGIGVTKLAEMSDLNHNLLRATRADFIRIETLCIANDATANFIAFLPIFKLWDLMDAKTLADADGQKAATSDDTIQSRYSKKYLGKGKGISLYTLIANFVAVNAKNLGLNEYEGHSLYDMIYGNKTDIEIDMVTGDNHSLNKLNFVALDAIDVEYVPAIKNIREAANDLYSVKSPEHYKGLLKPKGIIKIERIKSQKRGILRVLLSLIMQENTQTNIIRKLNSHARYARLRAGLYEYNKLFKSIHVLNLIDNMKLRKAIRTARNRTEAYHQLQGFIRKIYRGIFKGKRIIDNRVSAHATRLMANCIIAYNAIILNAIYEKMLKEGVSQEIIEEFARISPIAWTHILFTGRYNFGKSDGNVDMAKMIHALELRLKQCFWKAAA